MKKIISFFIALCIISSVFPAVSLADEKCFEDFSEYASSGAHSLPSGFSDINYSVNNSNNMARRVNLTASGGVLGKAENDTALVIDQNYICVSKGTDPLTRWYQARKELLVSGGKYFHISYETAFPTTSADRVLSVRTEKEDGSTAEINNLINAAWTFNSGEIKINVLGEDTGFVAENQKWMRFEIVIDSQSGNVDVYLNGEIVSENKRTGVSKIKSISSIYFAVSQRWGRTNPKDNTKDDYFASKTYIDNILCEAADAEPEIKKFNPYGNLDFSDYTGGFTKSFILNNAADKLTNAGAVLGAFGKNEDDVSVKVNVPYYQKSGSDSPARWQQVRYINPLDKLSENNPMYFRASFEMAYEGLSMNRAVDIQSRSFSGKINDHRILTVKNNVLTVAGSEIENVSEYIGESKWMKFDVVVHSMPGEASFDVFLNGRQISKDNAFTFSRQAIENWENLMKLDAIIFYINHEWSASENAFPECNTYFDNISVSTFGSYPKIDNYVPAEDLPYYSCDFFSGGEKTENIFRADSVSAIINKTDGAVPMIVTYSSSGEKKGEFAGDSTTGAVSASFQKGDKVVLSLWDSEESKNPVHDDILLIPSKSVSDASAENVKVSGMFTDNAILQRDKSVKVWGSAGSGSVNIFFKNQQITATVNDGKWEAELLPMAADKTGATLFVEAGDKSYSYENIKVGDVYFVAGQSNAELMLSSTERFAEDKKLLTPERNVSFFYQSRSDAMALSEDRLTSPQEDIISEAYKWEQAEASNVGKLSAIAFYFADKVSSFVNSEIPIGIVQTAFGGAFLAELSPSEINEKYGLSVDRVKYNAYNTLVHPTEKYSARGMLWYQGENDSTKDDLISSYPERFGDMVGYIRNIQGSDFPVFYVQLSSHADYEDRNSGWSFSWKIPKFRSVQNKCEDITSDSYMIASLDIGLKKSETSDTAHPKNKKPLGIRLANAAIERIYKENGDISRALSPKVKNITYTEDGALIEFERTNGGLDFAAGDELCGFELVKDNTAYAANAEIISENTVLVSGIKNPTGVRYAYYNAASPAIANLIGANGMPCPTFSDNAEGADPISMGKAYDISELGRKISAFKYDFSGLEKNKTYKDTAIGNFLPDNAEYLQNVVFDKVSGAFGRDENDESLYLHSSEYSSGNSDWFDQHIVLTSDRGLENGESQMLSFYIAADDMRFDKSVRASYTADGAAGEGADDILTFKRDGTIYAFGSEVSRDKILTVHKWYKVDLLVTAGGAGAANKFKLYIDNKLIAEKNFTPTLIINSQSVKKTGFEGFNTIRIGQNTYDKNAAKAFSSGMYLDDISLCTYTGSFAPELPMQTDISGKTANGVTNTCGIQFYDNAELPLGGAINGFEIIDGIYPKITLTDGEVLYSRIITEKTMIIDESFNSMSRANSVPQASDISGFAPEKPISMTWNYNNVDSHHSLEYQSGLGGRKSADKSMIMKTENFNNTTYNDPFVNISLSNAYNQSKTISEAYQPITIETSVMIKNAGDIRAVNMQAMFGGSLSRLWAFDNFGNIVLSDGSKVFEYETGKWYKIAAVIYPETAKGDLYINDLPVAIGHTIRSGANHLNMTRCKIETLYYPGTLSRSGEAAFDDLKIYTGLYKPGKVSGISSDKFRVNNELLRLYRPSGVSDSDLVSALESENEGFNITVSENTLAAEKNGIFTYYTVLNAENKADITYTVNGSTGQNNRFGSGTVKVSADISLSENKSGAALYAALYSGEKMISVAKSDKTDGGVVSCTLDVDSAEGKTIRLFVLDDKLSPVCGAIVLKPYDSEKITVDKEFYPGFVRKAVTFSYDDGVVEDERLVRIFRENNLGATFNLCSDRHTTGSEKARIKEVYAGFDIANHVKTHPDLSKTDIETFKKYVNEGKAELEAIFSQEVLGMAYPGNNPYRQEYTDYIYSSEFPAIWTRTSESSCSFDVPEDFLSATSTAHHSAINSLKDEFFNMDTSTLKVFSIWGHGYEFTSNNNWELIENFAKELGQRTDIWKPSVTEFVKYVNAQRALKIGDNYIENPSDTDVYVLVNGEQTVVPAGEKLNYN